MTEKIYTHLAHDVSYTCCNCGNVEESCIAEHVEAKICFTCDFWMEKVRWATTNPRTDGAVVVRINGHHFVAKPNAPDGVHYPVGHGGTVFAFEMLDGSVRVSKNVWHQGEIPMNFRQQLPDNAKRLLNYDEMVKLGIVKRRDSFVD